MMRQAVRLACIALLLIAAQPANADSFFYLIR